MPTQWQPPKQLSTPAPSVRQSIRPDLDLPLLEPSTIRLVYQLYQYLVQKNIFSSRPYLRNIQLLIEAVVSVYPIPQEYGAREDVLLNQILV